MSWAYKEIAVFLYQNWLVIYYACLRKIFLYFYTRNSKVKFMVYIFKKLSIIALLMGVFSMIFL